MGFVGLGRMGEPMVRRLTGAGYQVRGYDAEPSIRARLSDVDGLTIVDGLAEVVRGAEATILMLPNSSAVRAVLLDDGLLDTLPSGVVLIDMGSSEPLVTRELSELAGKRDVSLLDAPVSGGVLGARHGTLTVMVGGPEDRLDACRTLLGVLGKQVLHVGPVGAGHALKALNNLLSATHLLVSSEALLAGRAFGLDPDVMLDAINGSSGRSGSTENKWPRFVLPGNYASGFGLRLMLKDMRIATELARASGLPSLLGEASVELWARAAEELPEDADHTEVVRWLEQHTDRRVR
ncbi:MAG: NAD-binding protein [Pseudonocardiaceae bacterium]|nr:NAD-binding protein [Pseudonocardiaceae bacterium]